MTSLRCRRQHDGSSSSSSTLQLLKPLVPKYRSPKSPEITDKWRRLREKTNKKTNTSRRRRLAVFTAACLSFVFFKLLFSDLIVSEVCEINLTFTSPLSVCSFTGYIIRSGFIFARGHFLLLDPDRFLLYCLWKNKKFCRGHRRRRVMTGLKLEPDVKSVNLNHRRVFFFNLLSSGNTLFFVFFQAHIKDCSHWGQHVGWKYLFAWSWSSTVVLQFTNIMSQRVLMN